MNIIIPKNVSKYNLAIEISSLKRYEPFIEVQDINNVKSVLDFINVTTDKMMKKYVSGDIALNIIKNNTVKCAYGGANYKCSYNEIALAAEGKNYETLVSKLNELRNEDATNISKEAKRLFGDLIFFSPTIQSIGSNIPLYSFRFAWHKDANANRLNNVVLGIYDKLK